MPTRKLAHLRINGVTDMNVPTRTPRKIAVILGGDSAERSISLKSGAAVAAALLRSGHAVTCIDPQSQRLTASLLKPFDVAFIALHGTSGEDGQVQRQLEQWQIPFTFSGSAASALAFHKAQAKQAFTDAGLRTPAWQVIPSEISAVEMAQLVTKLDYPVAVKPVCQGSSLGVSIVSASHQLTDAIAIAGNFDQFVLIEQAIPGEEWTVPVFDDGALPPIRVSTPHPFFDFTAKYEDCETRYDVITDQHDAVAREVADLSVGAAQSLGCQGISRVDLRRGLDGQLWLLEVNTIPGLTDHSLVPKSAAAIGWDMSRLCDEIVCAALSAHPSHSETVHRRVA